MTADPDPSVQVEVEPTEGATPAPDKTDQEHVTEHVDDDPDATLDDPEDELD